MTTSKHVRSHMGHQIKDNAVALPQRLFARLISMQDTGTPEGRNSHLFDQSWLDLPSDLVGAAALLSPQGGLSHHRNPQPSPKMFRSPHQLQIENNGPQRRSRAMVERFQPGRPAGLRRRGSAGWK